jgi:tRNA(adenine34) deaminase
MTTVHERFMGLALDQAGTAFDSGQFPVGCVIVQDGRVIASGARSRDGRGLRFFQRD